ncbi:MAG: restriction endonuclease subunit S [Nitrospiria bacterium]
MAKRWTSVQLGDVLTERQEIPSQEAIAAGEIPIIAKISFGDGKIQLREDGQTKTGMILIRPGDLVVSGINAAKGAIGIYGEEKSKPIAATIHYGAYIPNKNRVDIRFLWWLLRSQVFRDLLQEHVPGGIKTELKAKRLLPIPIPLPPLLEQKQIAAWIEKVVVKIDMARGLRCQAAEINNIVFIAAMDQIAKDLDNRYDAQPIIDIVEPKRGISYGVVLTGTPYENGVPTLRAGDLQRFKVLLNNVKTIDPEVEGRYLRTRLQGTEVLLRIRGGIGEVAICPPEMIGGNVSREIAVIPFTDRVVPKFGMYLLSAPNRQERMMHHLRGTSYIGINLNDVRTLKIPVPPIPEQYRIISYLDNILIQINTLDRIQGDNAIELDAMLPSILDKVFKN